LRARVGVRAETTHIQSWGGLQTEAPLRALVPMSGATDDRPTLLEVLPKAGLVYLEKGNLSELLCKPKIMPIKSVSLERLEAMEQQAENFRKSNPTTAMPK
jgi:BBSome-interacting protein 1